MRTRNFCRFGCFGHTNSTYPTLSNEQDACTNSELMNDPEDSGGLPEDHLHVKLAIPPIVDKA